jgi:hypothetical protein
MESRRRWPEDGMPIDRFISRWAPNASATFEHHLVLERVQPNFLLIEYTLFDDLNPEKCNRSRGYCCLATTAVTSSRKTGTFPGAILFESPQGPRAGSSGTASTILAGPSGALGFTGELAADLFDA